VNGVGIGLVYPDLLGTYGDRGNAVVLSQRLRWREIESEIVEIRGGDSVPSSFDIYLLGGGEDSAQVCAASNLSRSRREIEHAVGAGAVVFGVCAGFQLLGESYVDSDCRKVIGLGLLDARTCPGKKRAVGECVVALPGESDLTGFENHLGVTILGPGASPLGVVKVGVGNGDGSDGAVCGRVMGTYLHGPILARNPEFADKILAQVVGAQALGPIDDHMHGRLRKERFLATRWSRAWFARRFLAP
jgi:lipid II isoglutaminyl synthase (glutamine-hydrolysing)